MTAWVFGALVCALTVVGVLLLVGIDWEPPRGQGGGSHEWRVW